MSLMAASAGGPGMSAKEVDSVLTKYRTAEAFSAKVKKTVVQEVLGTENIGDGLFFFSKGKLRLEMGEPENTTLVFDGKTIWMETRLDSKTVEVTKVKTRELKKNDSLLATLFERKDILQTFKMAKASVTEGLRLYAFEPKDKKKTEIRLLEIGLKDKDLARIAYRDDRENKVTFDFTDLVREPVDGSKFKYKPPKGANVTEL
jgi:outer membrane lipoprotein-sorting protein